MKKESSVMRVEVDFGVTFIVQKIDHAHDEQVIVLRNAKMVRKTIKALKKAAKELGWEV